jgi:Squalene-hopene cyclase C-terminal domain
VAGLEARQVASDGLTGQQASGRGPCSALSGAGRTGPPPLVMPTYHGSLGDAHVRAVVRAALRAHGFLPSNHEVRLEASAQLAAGRWLRDKALPEALPDAGALDAYRRLATVDPYIWDALPRVSGFGYRQATVLDRLAWTSPSVEYDVVLVGAAFNAAIWLLDYLVDEHMAGNLIFALVDDALISALFADATSWNALLGERRRELGDARVEVLLALIFVCVARARMLLGRGGSEQAWARLAEYVRAAYVAERLASSAQLSGAAWAPLVSALEGKATLPAKVMLQVSILATRPPRTEAPQDLEDRVVALGRLIGEIDDLVDVVKDCRAGVPSLLLVRLSRDLASRGRASASDTDVYQLIAGAADEIVTHLRSGGFLLESSRSPADDVFSELARFARMAVALWSGWDEESDVGPPQEAAPMRIASRSAAPARATRMLLEQRNEGYAEAVHLFPVPELGGDREMTYPALLYQRATILDALIDAHQAGLEIPRRVLDEEALFILQAKHQSMRGGWSYIPEMVLLPPDADDLGIVLQVLHRVGGVELAAACDEPVRLALDAAEPTGAVPTWIFGLRERSPKNEPAIQYLDAIGWPGDGAQPEVVANLCYGLVLHDRTRYRLPLERAASYLESVQADDGHWDCAWYADRYYGTYRAVSVLAVVRPESLAIRRARSFLLDRQGVDGGWGDGRSDPLNTGFAVLSLISCGMELGDGVAALGVEHLRSTQENDGGWPAVVWGSFTSPYGLQTYGSRTITTAFALKALLAVEETAR